jgi:uroporphyrinogen-III synthase
MKQGVLITRPHPLAERTAAAVAGLGFQPYLCPLLEIVPLPISLVTASYDGAIFTSATPFRLGVALKLPADLPLYVVGRQTGEAAREAGFLDIRHCAPDAASLAGWLNRQSFAGLQALVHYRGVHQAQDLAALLDPAKITLTSVPMYDTRVQPLQKTSIHLLLGGAVQWIMLYSRRSSVALAAAILGMEEFGWIKDTSLLCLSSAVKEPVYDLAWRGVQVAAEPDEAAMLACLQQGGAKFGGDGKS